MVLTFVAALFGAVYGLWEEIPAYSMAVVPLFVLAGYDVVTGIGVLTVGATAGNMASVVNPFSLGAAVGPSATKACPWAAASCCGWYCSWCCIWWRWCMCCSMRPG